MANLAPIIVPVSSPFPGAVTVNGLLTANASLVVVGTTTFNGNPLTWPAGTGALNNVLTTDGAGNLSWAAPAGGTTQRGIVAFTGLADAAVTPTGIVITVPNTSAAGCLYVSLVASSGASTFAPGGNEATAVASYAVPITRTVGVTTNGGGGPSVAYAAKTEIVIGSPIAGLTVALSIVVAGAVGAVQTVTINISITRGGGNSTNHVVQVLYEWIPGAVPGGITVAV